MTDELKPCPFCGHEPKYLGANAQFAVACVNDACLCLANSDYVGAWNTRPVEDALRARIYELETQWASVPWEALRHIYDTAQEWYSEHLNTPTEIDDAIVREWLFTCATPEADND